MVKREVIHTDEGSGATTSYLELEVDDGLSWEQVVMRESVGTGSDRQCGWDQVLEPIITGN